MIIREWRGRVASTDAAAYPRHFHEHVVPELRRILGFVGAHLSRRDVGGQIEFLVLTRWRSLDAITAFAGPELGRAVVEPGAVAALAEFDRSVQHYEVVEEV